MRPLINRWPLGLNGKTWPDRLAAILLVLFICVFFDVWTSQELQAWPDVWRAPFAFITDFGLSDWVLIPSIALLVIALVATRLVREAFTRRAMAELAMLTGFIAAAVGVPGLVANVLKRVFGRGRPDEFLEVGAFHFQRFFNDWTFQSFPSGHSTTAMATAIVVGFLAPRFFRLVLLIAVMTGMSRVVIGMHYPTDVLAGFLLGGLGAYAVRNAFAARRWLFIAAPDGTVRFRGLRHLPRWLRRWRQRARA